MEWPESNAFLLFSQNLQRYKEHNKAVEYFCYKTQFFLHSYHHCVCIFNSFIISYVENYVRLPRTLLVTYIAVYTIEQPPVITSTVWSLQTSRIKVITRNVFSAWRNSLINPRYIRIFMSDAVLPNCYL